MASNTTSTSDLWTCSASAALAAVNSRAAGLTPEDVEARQRTHGPNRIEEHSRSHLVVAFLQRFRNPLTIVLLGAAGIAAATGDPASFFIITAIVLLSIVLDFVQERRAENAAEKLRRQIALNVSVRRNGQPCEVPATEIVPGDVVLLSAGDLIPADCRLIEAKDLFVNEALLTGESFPAEKLVAGAASEDAAVPTNGVFAGSSVVSGTATALVLATGRTTRLGGIAHTLVREPPPTAFALGIRDFGLLIVRLTVLLVFFVLLVNLLFHRPLLESFLFALALAVGLTPELLPMIVTVTLAHGAIRMARKRVIVKRLSSIHDLGSMDVLCSDKTGTLTEAKIKLVRQVDPAGAESREVLRLAYLNAAFETGLKSPLDVAILEAAPLDLEDWHKVDEVPFDFERRRVSVLLEHEGRRFLVVKGAPEDVMGLSRRYRLRGRADDPALDDATLATAKGVLAALGSEGFRVLAVASREVEPTRDHARVDDERDLVLAGFVAFLDPPKEGAGAALAELIRLGVEVKIVTGDDERVTRHLCGELGIAVAGVLAGPELATLSDEALVGRLSGVNLFCRITPAQKARVVHALRRQGHVVGCMGDGINDAPSLHAADVGISVDSGVDVAKATASIILLEKDLSVLAEGVREGRRTFANIMKYVMMGTSSNFGNMFSMAGAVLFLPFLPMLPIQILLNNLLYDISETAIPLDRVDAAMIERPRKWDIRFVRNFMIVLGSVSSLFDALTFGLLIRVFDADEALFHTGWFVESLMTQILVIFVIRTRGSPLESRPHRLLVTSSLSVVAFAVALPYSPLAGWLGFVAPPPALLGALAGMTAAYLLAVEAVKRWFYARHAPDL